MSSRRHYGGPRQIGQLLPKITRNARARRGFAQHEIITEWPHIVGPRLASLSSPEKLQFRKNGPAHLVVRAALGAAPEIQHAAPIIIERLNTYFGYRAVERITLLQAPLAVEQANPPKQKDADKILSQHQKQHIQRRLRAVTDPELRDLLRSLGNNILARPAKSSDSGDSDPA